MLPFASVARSGWGGPKEVKRVATLDANNPTKAKKVKEESPSFLKKKKQKLLPIQLRHGHSIC